MATKAKVPTTSPEQLAAARGIDLSHELTKGFAARLIRHKAKQIARQPGFTRSDVDDIQQVLFQRIIENIAAFDPSQGHFNVFVTTVVERYAANILRDNQAEKRDPRRACPLSTVVDYDDNGPIELGETISQREQDARLGLASRSQCESVGLVLDVADVVATLPPELQDLCERLKHASVTEVAVQLGVPRTTIHERFKELRRRFAAAGLKNYL